MPKLRFIIASALFYFMLCWSINWWEEGKNLFACLMMFLPGLTFPLITCDYKRLATYKYSGFIKVLHLACSAGIYHGCVWIFSGEHSVVYANVLSGSVGSLLFMLLTKYLLRVRLTWIQILYAVVLSGLVMINATMYGTSATGLGVGVMLWTLVNGVLLYYCHNTTVEKRLAPVNMDRQQFFRIYLKALKVALENDHIDHGYLVKGPDWYMDEGIVADMDAFMEQELADDDFVNLVEYYFDAMSHNLPDVGRLSVEDARVYIIEEMTRIKAEYKL